MRRAHAKTILPAIVIGLLLASCAHARGPITLRSSNDGGTVTVHVGQVLVLRLPSNPANGLRWETANEPDARVLIIVGTGYDEPPGAPPEAPGETWWKLHATGTGETSIVLRYLRPWVPEESVKQFRLTVIVK